MQRRAHRFYNITDSNNWMEYIGMNTNTVNEAKHDTDVLMRRFKDFYRDLKQVPLDDIAALYSEDVKFVDPVHEINGNDTLRSYMETLCQNLTNGRFEYLDEMVGAERAYIKWNMRFVHPKLGGKVISVRGISHIRFNDRIYFHEDVYDLGQMLYQHVPVIGGINTWLKNNLKGK